MTVPLERTYRIGNDLERITEVVGDIVSLARAHFPNTGQLEVAVYEALYNAIEHGNLGLSFDEKRSLIECGRHDEWIAARRKSEPYASRIVTVVLQFTDQEMRITVSDKGDGFDWEKTIAELDDGQLVGVNGRGIRIMQSAFDEVNYHERGTAVTLTKKRERT